MSPTAPLEIVAGLAPLGDGPAGHRRFVHRAIELGYGRVWLPETFLTDPVSFAGWMAAAAPGHPIGLGVLPAALRSGPQLAMTAATLAALGSQDVIIALGTSSPVVTARWHGRTPTTVASMQALLGDIRAAAAGRTDGGFVNGLGPTPMRLHVAAMGPRMLRLAGRLADGVALNFVGPAVLPELLAEIEEGARAVDRPRPPVTVWAHATVEPDERTVRAARRWLGAYLKVPGYDRILARQGYGPQVDAARLRSPVEAAELVDDDLLASVAGFGDVAAVARRLDSFVEHGVHVALMPGAVRPGEATVRTLEALAPAGHGDGPAPSH